MDFLHVFQRVLEMLIRQVPTKIPTNCYERKIGPMPRTKHDAKTCEANTQLLMHSTIMYALSIWLGKSISPGLSRPCVQGRDWHEPACSLNGRADYACPHLVHRHTRLSSSNTRRAEIAAESGLLRSHDTAFQRGLGITLATGRPSR